MQNRKLCDDKLSLVCPALAMVDYYTARVDYYSVAQETVKANSVGALLGQNH